MVNYVQRLLIKSIFSKLAVVKFVGFYEAVPLIDKLQIVFNMRKKVFTNVLLSIYFNKKNGTSNHFKILDFYKLINCHLIYLSLTPYYESSLNRFTVGYRPFRPDHDAFNFLKIKFFAKKNIKRFFFLRKFDTDFLLKHWDSKLFRFSNLSLPYFFADIQSPYILKSLLNFSIIGLVVIVYNSYF